MREQRLRSTTAPTLGPAYRWSAAHEPQRTDGDGLAMDGPQCRAPHRRLGTRYLPGTRRGPGESHATQPLYGT